MIFSPKPHYLTFSRYRTKHDIDAGITKMFEEPSGNGLEQENRNNSVTRSLITLTYFATLFPLSLLPT